MIPSSVEIIDSPGSRIPLSGIPQIKWTAPEADPFSHVFQEIMSYIRQGSFEKTVPVVVEKGTTDSEVSRFLQASLWRQKPPLMTYGWNHGAEGFAGATPELLFSLSRNTLHTMALAGTARIEDRGVFAVDEKEIREHEYVAQTLAAKLLDFGHLQRDSREILSLGSIVHFLTRFRVELEEFPDPVDWIRRLHPTPALGSLPRTRTNIDKLVSWRERLGCPPEFGAPFGLWKDGAFQAVVAIRGIWHKENDLRIPAGCGIIEASRLVNEWRELRLKRQAVKSFIS